MQHLHILCLWKHYRDLFLVDSKMYTKKVAKFKTTFLCHGFNTGIFHNHSFFLWQLDAFHFHALEKKMATHSGILAWRIPGTGEPGGLPSMGSHRVRHDWSILAAAYRLVYLNCHLIMCYYYKLKCSLKKQKVYWNLQFFNYLHDKIKP